MIKTFCIAVALLLQGCVTTEWEPTNETTVERETTVIKPAPPVQPQSEPNLPVVPIPRLYHRSVHNLYSIRLTGSRNDH